MRQRWLLLLLMLLAFEVMGQEMIVRDFETRQPLVGVSISSDKQEILLITDDEGRVDVTPIEGASTITAQYLGYRSKQVSMSTLKQEGYVLYLEKESLMLDQIVVAATRWGQQKRNVPGKISSIRSEDVELKNPQTAADLLGMNGEIFIQKSQQGGGSPMIRGFSTNRLLYAVDGIRMNTAIFRSGNLHNVIAIDPFSIERTEVVFGPGSVSYGSDAIGGVMSFQTVQPSMGDSLTPEVSGSLTGRYATANQERTGHFDFNLGWKKWALKTSISSFQFGDLRMGHHGPDDYLRPQFVQRIDGKDVEVANDDPEVQVSTGYDQINVLQKLLYQPNEQWSFNFGFIYSTTTDIPRYDRLTIMRNDLPQSAEWAYGPQEWMMNVLTVNYLDKTALFDQAQFKISFQRFEESRRDRNFQEDLRYMTEENVDAYSFNADFYKSLISDARLTYGIEVIYNDVISDGAVVNISSNETMEGPSRYPKAQWLSYAGFVTLNQNLGDKFNWQAGIRYNRFAISADFSRNRAFYPLEFSNTELNNGALSGSLGLIWRPRTASAVSLNLSSGFRSPNVDDIGKVFDSEPGAVVVPNVNLNPEQAYNVELGLAQRFGENIKVDAALYYTILDHALVRRDFNLNGADSIVYNGVLSQVQAVQNAAQAFVYGCQVGVEVKMAKSWSWLTNFNYQMGEEETDDGTRSKARHAAPAFGRSRLRYNDGRFRFDLGLQWNAERPFEEMPIVELGKEHLYARDDKGRPYSPAWYTLDFNMNYQISSQLSLGAALENITDQRYRAYSSGIAGAGRNFILSLKFDFK